MQLFQWDSSFLTGSDLVDGQHEQLVNLINRFGKLLSDGSSNPRIIENVCVELIEYTNKHFTEEERLMVSVGLDKRHLLQHHKQHEDLISQIDPMRQLVLVGDLAAGKYMFEFLANWLVFHILGTDMLMSRQIKSIERGAAAEETYSAEEIDRNSNRQLLSAVKKLLLQASQRNKMLAELNKALEQKVEERTLALTKVNHQLRELASTDVLTGLLNRRAFMEEAQGKFQLASRYQRPLSILMVDIDHFKRVNDTYGHHTGDLVLAAFSKVMKGCLRETDILGRIGGEEFAIILPETGLDQTAELAERLLEKVRTTMIEIESGRKISLTTSIGGATVSSLSVDVDKAMKAADKALYEAKSEGRDRCCFAATKGGPST
jgi:diguanylate cyclase (GGDEF)-like protein/hemerythrin-like metal-binding protein